MKKMNKKVLFATLTLAIGLWSCSSDDNDNNDGKVKDGYVDLAIGTTSQSSSAPKSIVAPGGTTSWDVIDEVSIIDVDGIIQPFTYGAETPKSSAIFNGKLRTGQGKQTYVAYHAAKNAKTTLRNGSILVVEREDIEITENGSNLKLTQIGAYCPMVALPLRFDANTDDSKLFQFYHLACMIEGRVSLRETQDAAHLAKTVDKVVFELKSTDGKAFYNKTELDLNKLAPSSTVADLTDCVTNFKEVAVKTDIMTTVFNLNKRTIKELIAGDNIGSFCIPIMALPTKDAFLYTGTISFYNNGVLQLKMEGSEQASGLNPAGLNILNFDHKKIVN